MTNRGVRSITSAVLALPLIMLACTAPTRPAAPATSAPAPAPTTTTAASSKATGAAWEAAWAKTVAAAKGEKVMFLSHASVVYEALAGEFQKTYPDIPIENTRMQPAEFAARVITEQKNNQFVWDVVMGPASNMHSLMVPAGAFQEMPPFFINPEFQDDAKWKGGFATYSSKTPYLFAYNTFVSGGIFVNRDFISKEQLNSVDQLLDPSFKEKIVVFDPTRIADGSATISGFLKLKGEDFVKRLLSDQKLVHAADPRTQLEWFVTGQYPISLGVDPNQLREFQNRGVGTNVERIVEGYANHHGVAVLKNAPNQNAAKVFLNWFLSKEGQEAWLRSAPVENSRRADLPLNDPTRAPDYNRFDSYVVLASEDGDKLIRQTLELVKQHEAAR